MSKLATLQASGTCPESPNLPAVWKLLLSKVGRLKRFNNASASAAVTRFVDCVNVDAENRGLGNLRGSHHVACRCFQTSRLGASVCDEEPLQVSFNTHCGNMRGTQIEIGTRNVS